MQFHEITHPDGRLEFDTVEAKAKARAKEIGGTTRPVEIATDKKSLLEQFNKLAGSSPARSITATPAETPIEIDDAPSLPAPKGGDCPKCHFDRRSAERYAAQQARTATNSARADWIAEEADMMTVARLAEAVSERYTNLSKQIRETA
jgi:hypothetical protein